ncbi:VirB2 family type IV secretion system major pilin TrwL [Bartonella phoceensis]|uniref:VirB2 family type IV secretion system major pilin TrwL n=1 Tax=Bartonella phoceensis TaxID=270249 RepID=UPI001ABA2CA9|nr:VirB2 family type IV secretion system major pilin TrwL [Bartonella phoceensis]
MKQSNILLAAVNNRIIETVVAVTTFFMAHPVCAQAQDLTKVRGILDKFKTELGTIIPIAAAVILLCLAIGYAGRYIEKDTFVRWAIGVVIAGSAAEIANLLFTR